MTAKRKPLPEDVIAEAFGVRFRTICRARFPRMGQTALARVFGVSQPMISDYMAGKKLPSLGQAINMCLILECSFNWLLLGEGDSGLPDRDMLDMSLLKPRQRKSLIDLKEQFEKKDGHDEE